MVIYRYYRQVVRFVNSSFSREESVGDTSLQNYVLVEELDLSSEVSADDLSKHANMPKVDALLENKLEFI